MWIADINQFRSYFIASNRNKRLIDRGKRDGIKRSRSLGCSYYCDLIVIIIYMINKYMVVEILKSVSVVQCKEKKTH